MWSVTIRTRDGPLALLHHRLNSLDNAWVCLADILRLRAGTHFSHVKRDATANTHGKVLEGTRLLNVGEGSLEILELRVDFLRGLLRLRNLTFPTHRSD